MADDPDFHIGELEAQQRWRTSYIWDKERRSKLLWDHIPEALFDRIEGAPFFFLATSSRSGECDCSFKGGGPGLIRIVDTKNFAFPDFDGNGAFMSIGNILQNPHVGCLFIDFSTGERLRVNGRASIHDSGEIMELFPEHPRVILVEVEQIVPNCSAHIPKLLPAV
jgi:predicted pyridoxine 5'-phosphate oxidase superfamily flavin-nucleotide-binding protein